MSDDLVPPIPSALPMSSALSLAPVHLIPGDAQASPPTGTGLCLSGGGYRAMLFHVGVLRRLYETGDLARLDRISSVSGGSITAAVLALAWPKLYPSSGTAEPDAFTRHVQDPVCAMASTSIDIESVLTGIVLPWASIGDKITDHYRSTLYGEHTLADLPATPIFVINATNLASGVLLRFTKDYLADWRVGWIPNPEIDLATAVAASSAFPPFLSPHEVDLRGAHWRDPNPSSNQLLPGNEYRGVLRLADGGVYDNLGLETVWKRCATVIVSDAGGQMAPDPTPATDWARGSLRVLDVIDHQVRSLRKRQLIASYKIAGAGHRDGTYVGTYSDLSNYPGADPNLPADHTITTGLAMISTRLSALPETQQHQLINWGYVITDAGLRSHLTVPTTPGALPFPHDTLT